MKIALLMVVSPGEHALAADSLARARACLPEGWPAPDLVVVNNTGNAFPPIADGWAQTRIVTPPDSPRPYFEIARTIALGLLEAAALSVELVFKIDPDTVVTAPGFFTDIAGLHRDAANDFYSWFIRYPGVRANFHRWLRLCLDSLPLGLARTGGGDRYGQRLRLRAGSAWHARSTRRALFTGRLTRAQPSGGGYVVRADWLRTEAFHRWATAAGPNGLEWNDDTLLPVAVRAAGGRVVDLRERADLRAGWRWMHGSRYFTREQALEPGLRALHPLKDNPEDQVVRRALDSASRA